MLQRHETADASEVIVVATLGWFIFVPPFNDIFHTVPFGIEQVIAIGLVGSLVLWVEELRKLIARRRRAQVRAMADHVRNPCARRGTSRLDTETD